ncbi:hypothetical protein [Ottowia sp. oral taxon 894]|uniref:hypothetical protein n=1 Tax=Ottowia sp. oral taxon 894 TaxID=1658672 RepID=UPI0006810F23|nr:hypothetical protein [Ottowia sp. oral taxon 894]AKU66218.1 hypothetical protein ADJ79_01310 [Ottowia sp. oral taxon 894]
MADKGYARSAVKSWLQITKAACKCYFRLGRNGLRTHSNPAFHPCRIKFSWPRPPFSRMNSSATYSFSNSEYTASGAPFSRNLKNAQGESGWRKTQPVGEAG